MKKKGFTLIELLVVIAIIGMLAGIVLVSLTGARLRARDVRRQADIRQIITAQEMFMGDQAADVYFRADGAVGLLPAIATGTVQYMASTTDPVNTGVQRYVWFDNLGTLTCPGALPLAEGQYFCAVARAESPGSCTGGTPIRYFVAYQAGTKEDCSATEYSAGAPPSACECADGDI